MALIPETVMFRNPVTCKFFILLLVLTIFTLQLSGAFQKSTLDALSICTNQASSSTASNVSPTYDKKLPSRPKKFSADYNLSYMDSKGVVQPRVFPVIRKPIPCFSSISDERGTPSPKGFFFHKPVKVGGSTAAGIHLRIANKEAARQGFNFPRCLSRFKHHQAEEMFGERDRSQSFLWTIFRDPTSRFISMFFHMTVSRRKKEPSDANFMALVNETTPHYLGCAPSGMLKSPIETGNQLIKDYDFIAITERWEESMVALSMILDIPVSNVLHISAKTSGGYDDGRGGSPPRCIYIVPSFVSSGMEAYFNSKDWWDKVHSDFQIYRAANASLDLTIAALDPSTFRTRMSEYRRLQSIVKQTCEAITVFPCDETGRRHHKTDCVWGDSGCGHECMDRMETSMSI